MNLIENTVWQNKYIVIGNGPLQFDSSIFHRVFSIYSIACVLCIIIPSTRYHFEDVHYSASASPLKNALHISYVRSIEIWIQLFNPRAQKCAEEIEVKRVGEKEGGQEAKREKSLQFDKTFKDKR